MGFFDNFKKGKGKKMPVPPKPKNAQLFEKSPSVPPPKPPVPNSNQKINKPLPWPAQPTPSVPTISPFPEKKPMPLTPKQPEKKQVSITPKIPKEQKQEIKQVNIKKKEKQAPEWHEKKQRIEQKEIPDELPELPIPNPEFLKEDTIHDLPEFSKADALDAGEILESFPLPEFSKKQKSLFVRTDNYKQMIANLDSIKNYVEEGPNTIYMLKNLKRNADAEHKNYLTALEDIQRKLMYVENILSQATRY